MSEQAKALTEQIKTANRQLMTLVEACADEAWHRYVPDEERTVAVVAHHVASAYLVETELVDALAGEEDAPPLHWKMDHIDKLNAGHVRKHARPTKDETLALLRRNFKVVARRVGELGDAELQRRSVLPFMGDEAVSTKTFIEQAVIGHIHGHRRSMETVMTVKSAM